MIPKAPQPNVKATRGVQGDLMRHSQGPGVRWRVSIAVAYLLLLTYLLGTPHPLWLLGETGETVDQAVEMTLSGFSQHVMAYTLLAWLLCSAFGASSLSARVRCLLLAAAHGLIMEGVQYFLPFRYCDWADTVGNLAGVGLGGLATMLSLKIECKRALT